ncbi:hypothetical protein Geu3261_0240_008 [Komagataeibacter europaeus NBRC 3261]|uniref:Uncharacterized protein n=1 Tax=Komagataeibacter europaeus NBRC 3261 TaxID=1234669 RepID=A0A0D6Q366_KOMEU|nr:hypothetical protein Geu3261_0240_008 [Komagataeibacter europaeus NBRC 3261]
MLENFYRCSDCHEEWVEPWECEIDEDCPHCGTRHITPYKSLPMREGFQFDT